jgi:Fe2+ or Zn2+ uptake regulation protein
VPRPSRVRDAIHALFLSSSRHDWSPEDVHAALAADAIPADFSSICRGLTYLETAGAIRRVSLGDERTRYEAAGEHHDHARCTVCGMVTAVPDCTLAQVEREVEQVTGFIISEHQVVFSGMCEHCARGRT